MCFSAAFFRAFHPFWSSLSLLKPASLLYMCVCVVLYFYVHPKRQDSRELGSTHAVLLRTHVRTPMAKKNALSHIRHLGAWTPARVVLLLLLWSTTA